MLRFASSATMYFTWSICPCERYAGSPGARRPGERLIMKMPFASIASRSREIRARTSAASYGMFGSLSIAFDPFQLWNCCIAPYSRGGDFKFAATSAVDAGVTCCHGRGDCACACAFATVAISKKERDAKRTSSTW